NPSVRVVLLRGAGGKSFISGGDIGEMSATPSPAEFAAAAEKIYDLFDAVLSLPMPTIAVIEGYALGSGLSLALLCDMRICTPNAGFGTPIARTTGHCLTPREMRLMVNAIGSTHAKELLMRAMIVPAEKALAWGIVNEIVEHERLEERVAELTAELSANAPLTMWATKEMIRRLVSEEEMGTDITERVFASEDFREGV